jgi:hypothetical protein
MKYWRVMSVVAAAAAALACAERGIAPADSTISLQRDESPVQTDSLSYGLTRGTREYRAYAMATYRNTTGAAVYFPRCGNKDTLPMFGIARTGPDSLRRLFVDFAWACVGGVPTGVIAPGHSVTVRVPLGSVDQPNMTPPLQPADLVGQLRVELELCSDGVPDSERCTLLPAAARRSNSFVVHY